MFKAWFPGVYKNRNVQKKSLIILYIWVIYHIICFSLFHRPSIYCHIFIWNVLFRLEAIGRNCSEKGMRNITYISIHYRRTDMINHLTFFHNLSYVDDSYFLHAVQHFKKKHNVSGNQGILGVYNFTTTKVQKFESSCFFNCPFY